MPSNSKNLSCSNTSSTYLLSVNWSVSSQNIPNNTSVISASGSLGSSNVGWDSNYDSYLKLYWHDNNTNTDEHFATSSAFKSCGYGFGTRSVAGSITVSHKSDGTLSGYVKCEYVAGSNSGGWAPASNSVATAYSGLATIPRASAFGAITGSTIGGNITVNIDRKASFTHTLWYSYGNSAWYEVKSGIDTKWTFPLPMNVCNAFPNSTSGSIKLMLRTYSGSTAIGSDVVTSHNVNVPSSVVPSISSVTASRVDNGVPAAWGVYVKGYSKATVSINGAAGSYGSTIKSYLISGGGMNSSRSSDTTPVLQSTGTITFNCTVTDSRGRTATKPVSISVQDYFKPSIAVSAKRCDVNGNENSSGTYLKCIVNYNFATVASKNSITSKSATCNGASNTSFGDNAAFTLAANVSIGSTYIFTASVTDALGNKATATTPIPTAERIMNVKANKKGIAFGGFAEEDGVVDFKWKMKLKNGKYLNTELNRAVGASTSTTNSDTKYWKIKINSKESWMLCFTVRIYQNYRYNDIVISGYNYPAINDWHTPSADVIGATEPNATPRVIFGYDSPHELWVALTGGNYTGIDVFNVTNGYVNVMDYNNLFTIIHENTLTGTKQIELRPLPPYPSSFNKHGYWGISSPDGTDGSYIRTPQGGLLPYQPGGHGNIGSEEWPFYRGYFKNLYANGFDLANSPELVSVAGWDEAWKFPSGLMILKYWGTHQNVSWSAWGSLYETRLGPICDKTIPSGIFTSVPTAILGSWGYNFAWFPEYAGESSVTKTGTYFAVRAGHPGNGAVIRYVLLLVGRWK